MPRRDLTEPAAEVPTAAAGPAKSSVTSPAPEELPEPISSETSHQTDLEPAVDTPKELPTEMPADASKDALVNVVPFRAPGEAKPPSLTPVENNAFNELARQLSARLENETGMLSPPPSETDDGGPAPNHSSRMRASRPKLFLIPPGRRAAAMAERACPAAARRGEPRQGAARPDALGGSRAALKAVEAVLAKRPKIYGGGAGQVYLDPALARVFGRRKDGREGGRQLRHRRAPAAGAGAGEGYRSRQNSRQCRA